MQVYILKLLSYSTTYVYYFLPLYLELTTLSYVYVLFLPISI